MRGTGDRDRTHAGYPCQRSRDLVVQYLFQGRQAFLGCRGQDHDRQVVRTELENDRNRSPVRKFRIDQVQLVPHIICRDIDVYSPLEFEHDKTDVLLGLRCDVLQIADSIKCIFQHLGKIGLYIFRAGAWI